MSEEQEPLYTWVVGKRLFVAVDRMSVTNWSEGGNYSANTAPDGLHIQAEALNRDGWESLKRWCDRYFEMRDSVPPA